MKDDKSELVDPDDAPELSDEWFKNAYQHDGDVMIKEGKGKNPLN